MVAPLPNLLPFGCRTLQSQEKFFHEWKEGNTRRVFALRTNQREFTRVET